MTQYVSGTIVPIFKSARLYTTAYGFHHLMCWLETWAAASRSCALCRGTGHTTCLPATQDKVLKNICSSVESSAPEDENNGARNMLSHWFINKS